MKHLLKIISSLTILSTGILSVSCTNKNIKNKEDNKESNNASKYNNLSTNSSIDKIEEIVGEDIKNKAIIALEKVFKEQEDAFGSFHTYQDVIDQIKVYLKDSNIYHLNYLKLTNENEKNTKLQVDKNSSGINKLSISYFDKAITFIPKTVLKDEVKEKYDNNDELIQVGYKLDPNIKNIKMTTVKKDTKKVPKHLPLKINSLDETFKGLKSEKIKNLEKWDTKNIKFLTKTFADTDNFNQSINSWDVSNVIDMTEAFAGAKKFNINLNSWDTSKVREMKGLFWEAENFNGDISKWKTASVEDMSVMFSGAKKFNQDISKWDTSRVLTMEGMFTDAELFNSNISKWNTSSVSSMNQMFENAKSFRQNLSSWNTKKVTRAKDFIKGIENNISNDYLPQFNKSILDMIKKR
ncbi:BspA family leucine-rich repeat surface protein [Mycoplasma capricolum subsp. capricolum]|uniref:BspA family leucine-rich repeat surface protein n=1 Tax=Mycoplasma capricolum TaxID=2095 RepID=UPI003DA1D356